MKRNKYIIFFFIILACAAYAFDWPLKKKALLSSFCQDNGEGFSVGIHLSGPDEPVYPIAPGEIIFIHEAGEDYFSLPYGLGNFLVLWHEGSIQSAYCQLKTGSINRDKIKPDKDEAIGIVGNTGATIGGNLRLIIFNIEENEILNPIKNLIPYYEDKKTPLIRGIYMKRDNKINQLKNRQVIPEGKAEILVNSYDLREDKNRIWEIAPYKILLFHNGQKISQVSFDAIREKENEQILNGKELKFRDIYEDNWMYKLGEINFHEGTSHILIRVNDFAGNMKSAELFIKVE